GVCRAGRAVRRGGDVRLLARGEGGVGCLGGLRNLGEARYEMAAPPGALQRGPRREWHEERAGSLVTANQVAGNLGIQLWLELLGGGLTSSRWLRLGGEQDGLPTGGHPTGSAPA